MRLIVFDMDGTLVDSHGFIISVVRATFERLGQSVPSADEVRDIIGLSNYEAFAQLTGQSGDAVRNAMDTYQAVFNELRTSDAYNEPTLFDGIPEVLTELSARPETLLGIATGKSHRGMERVLQAHGIRDLFVTRQTPDENPSKPHPGMLQRAMAEAGTMPNQTVMIGDSSYDIEMARAAGTGALGVTWGSHEPDLLAQSGAHIIIDRVSHMIDAIDDILDTRAQESAAGAE
ncbi:MAG: HAD-IA family hydrolase [Hyphomicrobiaceae bacterium]|nr:HAD-IA family hydrolase [Hyphomicrobiaceae bacterium]